MEAVSKTTAMIQQQIGDLQPTLGIVLGSGLGSLAERLEEAVSISYESLPNFPKMSVKGHAGNLIVGKLKGKTIVCLQGRAHPYEGMVNDTIKTYIRTLKQLGCKTFVATNAAGSLHTAIGPGSLVVVSDHINFQWSNPLVGLNDDDWGPRFLPLDKLYNKTIRQKLHACAEHLQIPLYEGVYMGVMGPNYETAAEISAFRSLGADLVGMSTIPEVLLAHHCGMKVAAISTVTNFATGIAESSHDHNAVVTTAKKATNKLCALIEAFVEQHA